ncbi:hypothetical protein ACUOA8_52045, partial [Escherichia sp. SS-MK2]
SAVDQICDCLLVSRLRCRSAEGGGLKQITGLSNYRSCGQALKLDLVTHPELLEQDDYAARSAAWFYVSRGCMLHSGDIERVTLLINGGRNGLDKRRALF